MFEQLVTFDERFLLFNYDNWNVPQQIDVRAFDNAVDVGVGEANAFTVNITHHVISYTPGYKEYDGLHHLDDGQPYTMAPTDVAITIFDNDEAGVEFDHSLPQAIDGVTSVEGYAIEIPEAQPGHYPNYYDYSIQLLCKPSFHPQYPVVRLAVTTNNTRLAVGSAAAENSNAQQQHVFEFTNETWQTAQTIRLTLDTGEGEFRSSNGPEIISVEHTIVEGDPEYVDLVLPSAIVVVLNNDVPGVLGFPSTVYMLEGQPYNVSLTLASEPTAFVDATFGLVLNASGVLNANSEPGLMISHAGIESDTITHRFHIEDWDVPFVVTLVPQHDFVFEGMYSYDLNLVLHSADELYSLVASSTARVYLEDDDSPGVLVAPCVDEGSPCNTTSTVYIEESNSPSPPHGFYEVRLRSEPVAAVAVTVSSADPSNFVVSSDVDVAGVPGQTATLHFGPSPQLGVADDWWRQPQRVRIDVRNFNWATTPEPLFGALDHVVHSEDPSYNDTAVDPLTMTIVPRQLCSNPYLDPVDIRGDGVDDGVPTAGQETSFTVVVKDSQGKVCANSWDIITISIDHPDGVSFPWPAGKLERDIVPSIDKVNPRDDPDSDGTVIVHYTVNPHGPYIITVGAGATQVARTVRNNLLPPPVVTATFVDSLKAVRISFSTAIHGHHNYSMYTNYRGGQRLAYPDGYLIAHSVSDFPFPPSCATWLASGTMALLGVGPTCTWTNSSHMRIDLGARYALAPDDALTFNYTLPGSNVSLIAAYNSLPAQDSVVVAPATNPEAPVLVLNAPSVVGKCTDVVLDASASLRRSPSRLSFEWSVVEEATTTWTGQEDPRCPCLDWADQPDTRAQFENADGTALIVRLGDPAVDFTYPLGYGSGACAAHDATLQPFCSDASGAPLPDAPDWCQASWCWVDRDNCQLSANESSVFSRYYSYETCDAKWGAVQTELAQHLHIPAATVASGLLPFGDTTYVLTIANTHGMSQNTTVTVNRSTTPRPSVAIAGPSSYAVTATDVLDLNGRASVVVGPQCVNELQRDLAYRWEIRQCANDRCTWATAAAPVGQDVFDQEQSQMPSVRLEASRLAAGHKYLVRLSVSTRADQVGFAEVQVRVDRSELIARILVGPAGSGREALQHVVTEADGAVLDGSTSLDPDQADAGLLYEWQCVSVPICNGLGAFDGPVWDLARFVSGFGWSPGTHEFRLTVTDQFDTDRYSISSTTLVIPNPNVNHPTVAIVQRPTGKVNPQDRLVVKAHAINRGLSSQLDLRWSSVDFLNLGAAVSGTLDSANLVVKGNQLAPGSTYRFKILACAGPCEAVNPALYTSYDAVTIIVNEPPKSSGAEGMFVTATGQPATGSSVTPLSGVSLEDEFTLDAGWDWQDDDLPLSYSYASQVVGGMSTSLLVAASVQTSAKSILPAGLHEHSNQIVIISIVTDGLGASSEAHASVTVYAPDQVTHALVDDKLSEAQDLKNTDMLLQRMDVVSNLLNHHGNRRRLQSEDTPRMTLRTTVLDKVPLAEQWLLPSQASLSRILQTIAMATAAPDELNSQTIADVLGVLDGLFDNPEYASVGLSTADDCFTVADHVFDTLRSRASDSQYNHVESISSLTQFISEAAQAAGTGLVAGEGAARFSASDSFDVTIKKFDDLDFNELTVELTDAENVTFVFSASAYVTAQATAWSFNPHDYTQPDDDDSVLVTPVVRLELQADADESSLSMFPVQVNFPSAHLDVDAQHPEQFLSLVGWVESDWVSVGSVSSGGTDGRRMQSQSGPTFDITSLLVGGSPVHELGVQALLDYHDSDSIPEQCSPLRLGCDDTLNDNTLNENDARALASVPPGQFLLVECASQCNTGVVGTQIYSADSTICAAARHSCGHEAQHQQEVSCVWEGWKTFAVVIRGGRDNYLASTTTVSLEPDRTISSEAGDQTSRSFQMMPRDCVLPPPEPEPEPAPVPEPEPEPAPPAPPQPVDCVGTWGDWSACTAQCGGGQETRSYGVTTTATDGGEPCPTSETRACNDQPCPVDCYVEYLPCTDRCESASERQRDLQTFQAPEHGGAACPAPEDCVDGEGECEFLSGVTQPLQDVTDAIVPDDDNAAIAGMVLLACALLAVVGCYVRKKKQAVAEGEMWNSAALSQKDAMSEDGVESGMPRDARRPTTPQRGGSGHSQAGDVSPTGSLASRSAARYRGDGFDPPGSGGSHYSESFYGAGPPGPLSVRSDGTAVSRRAEREARLEKARSLVSNRSNETAPSATRATTPPRRMSLASAAGDRRLSPARPRSSQARGASVFAAAASASAVAATKPRSAAFARAQLLLAQSQSRRAQSMVAGQPTSPSLPGSEASALELGRRLTPTRTSRSAAVSARLRPTTPPRARPLADGDNE